MNTSAQAALRSALGILFCIATYRAADGSMEPMGIRSLFRHRKKILIGTLVALVVAFGLSYVSLALISAQQLLAAVAEADELDPGWSISELEAKRAHVSDDENSGVPLMAAKGLLPRQWPFWWYDTAPESKAYDREELRALQESFNEPDPQCQLDDRQIKVLRAEMNRAAAALSEVRKVADMPKGRYPIQYSRDGISTPLNPTQNARHMVNVLDFDVVQCCQDLDFEGALKSCRAIFNVGHSIGDEPTLISTLVRIVIHQIGVKKLERILAQGEISDANLAAFQDLLEKELDEPLLLISARGERALTDCLMDAIEKGDVRPWQVPQLLNDRDANLDVFEDLHLVLVPGSGSVHRATMLRFNSQFVEIAKRPVEEQKKLIDDLEISAKSLPALVQLVSKGPIKVARAYQRDRAVLGCGLMMIAVERYRLAHVRWPNKLEDLVGTYVKKLPLDPADGKPIKYRKDPGFVSLYAVGADEKDHGGKVANVIWKRGFDYGLRLWDVAKRRQPPKPRAETSEQ